MKFSIFLILFISLMAAGCKNAKVDSLHKVIPQVALDNTEIKAVIEGEIFRDLNHNGKIDVYEDINQTFEERIKNLIDLMTLEEKAGMMFINGVDVNEDASLEKKEGIQGPAAFMPAAIDDISNRKMTHFNIWNIPEDPEIMAKWYNNLQRFAEQSRLGIPVTIASDPRHHFSNQIFSLSAKGFSQFCETLGFAAIGDENVMKAFAEIVR